MRSLCNLLRSSLGKIGVCESVTLTLLETERIDYKASSSFRLDVGKCSKLRSITFGGTSDESSTISNLVASLSTLQNFQKLSRIRVLTSNFSFLSSDMRSPSEPEVWQRLDEQLCGLCPQTRKEDSDRLTFQIASRKALIPLAPSGYLPGLLPEFSRIGTCEEVEF